MLGTGKSAFSSNMPSDALTIVLRHHRQIGRERLKAMHRQSIGSHPGRLLADCGLRAPRLRHHTDTTCLGSFCRIIEQHRRQPLAHVPFDVIGQHTEKYMPAHPIGQPVMFRRTCRSTVLMQRNARSISARDFSSQCMAAARQT